MPRRLYSATPTRLLTWLDCPRRYRMTYLDRPPPPKGPPWAHTSVGTAVHLALADWYALEPPERTPAAAARRVVARWRPEGFRDEAQSSRWRSTVADEVAAYVESQDPSSEPLGVERTVATRTARLALSGRVDRLDDRDGELVVVDYKTSRKPLREDDARTSLALAVYAVGASTVFRRPCHAVELHHVPTGQVQRHEFSSQSLRRKLDEADSIAADLVRADAQHAEEVVDAERTTAAFAPRTGPLCSWCDVRGACPEGQRAAPAKQPWSALEPG